MKALLLKDKDWLLFFLFAVGVMATLLVQNSSFSTVWVGPGYRFFEEPIYMIMICAGLFGVFAAIRDELTRTEEYLRHRPVSLGQIFWVKTGACLVVIGAWISLPFLVHAIFPGLWSENRPIADWDRLGVFLGAGTIGFSCFSAAYFAGTLGLHWGIRLFVGIVVELGVVFLAEILKAIRGDAWAESVGFFVLTQLLITGLFLWASWWNFQAGKDADKPRPRHALALSAGLVLAAASVCSGVWVAGVQGEVALELALSYPVLIREAPDKVGLYEWTREDGNYRPVDAQHNRIDSDRLISYKELNHASSDPVWYLGEGLHEQSWAGGDTIGSIDFFNFEGEWSRVADNRFWTKCYLHQPGGLVSLLRLCPPNRSIAPSVVMTGKTEQRLPFSRQAEILPSSNQNHLAMIGDPVDGQIWLMDLEKEEDYFQRVPLPGEDRFLHHQRIVLPDEEIEVEGRTYVTKSTRAGIVVKGEQGIYCWNGTVFEPAPSGYTLPSTQREASSPFRVVRADPITPEVAAFDAQGSPFFTHQYDLHRTKEKLLGGVLYFFSLLRAPVCQVYSYLHEGEAARLIFTDRPLLDPLLESGKRPGLLAMILMVNGLLSLISAVRLARRGGSRARTLFWFVTILAGGILVLIAHWGFETPRTHRKSQPVVSEVPALLIKTTE